MNLLKAVCAGTLFTVELMVRIGLLFGAYFVSSWLWSENVALPIMKAFGASFSYALAWLVVISPALVGVCAFFYANALTKPFDAKTYRREQSS